MSPEPFDYAQFLLDTDRKVFEVLIRAVQKLPLPEPVRAASIEGERRSLVIRNEHSGARARILKAICQETGAEPFIGLLLLQNVPQLAFAYADDQTAKELSTDTEQQAKIIAKLRPEGA